MNQDIDSTHVRAVLTVCLAFLQDTSPSQSGAPEAADCAAELLGLARVDLIPVALEEEARLASSGRWSHFAGCLLSLRGAGGEFLRSFHSLLMGVSLSDGKYEHAENRLISLLGKFWDIHASEDGEPGTWSVLSEDGVADDGWTPMHDLAILYLGLAHRTDNVLASEEIDAIRHKLGEWLPESLPAGVESIVSQALAAYSEGDHDVMLAKAMISVEQSVPTHQRSAVLTDLMFIARADNVVLVEERALIAGLAATWGIDPSTIA